MPLQAPKRLQVSCPTKNFSASQRAAASTPYATVAAEQRTLDRKSLIVTSFYRRRRSRVGKRLRKPAELRVILVVQYQLHRVF